MEDFNGQAPNQNPQQAPEFGQYAPTQGDPYQQQYQQQAPGAMPYQTQPVYTQPAYSQRSKIAAGLLAIFLGSLGIHNFYLGNTGKGVAQLLITLLTFGIGAIVTGVWSLIEGILILCSHQGERWHRDHNNVELRD